MFASLILFAWVIEVAFGWPKPLFRTIRHPVVWIGSFVNLLDKNLNRRRYSAQKRRLLGVLAAAVVVLTVTAMAMLISHCLPETPWGLAIEALIVSSLLASRSLYEHVLAVASPLLEADLPAAREAVSHIVGRDPSQLDSAGIARASIESLAENASDGIVAPVFWGTLFGLPGIAAYKAINTLDSMIGHHGSRYGAFGWASAKLDDVVNYVPARITALLFILGSGSLAAVRVVRADASLHRSPNAGWPEAALAGALDVRLSGPRSYQGVATEEPWVNGGCPDPDAVSIRTGLRFYVQALALMGVVLAVSALTLEP